MLVCGNINAASRKQQIESWEASEMNKEVVIPKPPDRVNFPIDVQFHAACKNGDLDEVKELLSKGVDIDVANVDGLTVLHQACIDNNFEVVQFLLSNKANVNAQDNEGWTPLHACASCSYTELAKLLLEHGANAGIVSFELELPVDVAQGGDMVSLLKEWMKKQSIDESAARSAEEQLMLKDAREWLASGQYPKVVDPRTGATALHIAAAKGYSEVLEVLLAIPGVEVDATDIDGWTPLHAAAHWAKEKPLRLLAGAGASFDSITLTNQSIYDVADRSVTMLLRQLRIEQTRAAANAAESAEAAKKGEEENVEAEAKKREEEEEEKEKEEDGKASELKELEAPKPVVSPPTVSVRRKAEDEEVVSKTDERRSADEDSVAVAAPKVPKTAPTNGNSAADHDAVEENDVSMMTEPTKVAPIEVDKPSEVPQFPNEEEEEEKNSKESGEATPKEVNLPSKPKTVSDETPREVKKPMEGETHENAKLTATDAKVAANAAASGPGRRSNSRRDNTTIKRISAVLAPARSEETEAQRSSKARLVRSTRRSTQGIANDVLEEARRLSAAAAAAASTPSVTAMASSGAASVVTPTPVQMPILQTIQKQLPPKSFASKVTMGNLSKSRARKVSNGSDVDEVEWKPASSVSTTHVSKATILPSQSSTSSPATTSTAPAPVESTPSSIIAHSRARRAARDRVPTGLLNANDVKAAEKKLQESAAAAAADSIGTSPADPIPRPTTRVLRSTILNTASVPSSGQPQATTKATVVLNNTSAAAAAAANNTTSTNGSSSGTRVVSPSVTTSTSPPAISKPADQRYNWRENLEYRLLYEEERSEKERLRHTLEELRRETAQLRSQLARHAAAAAAASPASGASPATLQRISQEYYEDLAKEIERLRQENARMADENKSLIRVINKLSTRTTS